MTGSGDTVSQKKRPVQEPGKSDVRLSVLIRNLVSFLFNRQFNLRFNQQLYETSGYLIAQVKRILEYY